MAESFGERLRAIRKATKDPFGRPLSQAKAARMFRVSLSCWKYWESGIHLPDARSVDSMAEKWPELFNT